MSEKQISALQQAQAIQAKAAKVGFDWADWRGVWEKVLEEIAEIEEVLPRDDAPLSAAQRAKIADELGDCLFALSNLARHFELDAETAAWGTVTKFQKRFAFVEAALAREGKRLDEVDLAEMERHWQAAKKEA